MARTVERRGVGVMGMNIRGAGSTGQRRSLGLAPLSVLGEAPHRIVTAAAAAGFDFVGLRVLRVVPDEPHVALAPGSAEERRTRAALADTGLDVLDVECLVLDGTIGAEVWWPALEAGAALGARTFTVASSDSDRHRIADHLAAFAQDARSVGIIPAFEPMAYRTVATLADAAALAREAGCLVLPDSLHYHRRGGTPDQAAAVADYAVMLQICDATAQPPADLAGYIEESRAHRLLPGDGAVDLAGFLGAFPASLPVSVEVPHPSLAELGLSAFARQLYAAGRACLDALGLPDRPPVGGLV